MHAYINSMQTSIKEKKTKVVLIVHSKVQIEEKISSFNAHYEVIITVTKIIAIINSSYSREL